jgi:UDP-glucose 4-epimerase
VLFIVTGARGAIGRHVIAAARARGARVVGLGHGPWTGETDLPTIDAWVTGDVTFDNLDALAAGLGMPDVIVHLAGGSHVGASIERPAEDFRRTVASAQNLFEWVRTRSPATRLVVASSAAVYGNAGVSPIPEDTPYAPASPYGTHKAMVEMLALAYGRQYGLNAAVVRLFSVYGPGLRKQLVYELFQRLMRGERGISLGGTGQETRDFLFISDAAGMLLDAAGAAGPDVPLLNGATGKAVTIARLAHAIAAGFGDASIRFTGLSRKGDPASLVGSISRSTAAGLSAPTGLEAGVAATRAWIEQNAGAL